MENTIFTVTGMKNKKYFQLKNSHKSDMKRTRLFYIVFINFCLSHFLCNLKEYIRYAHIYKQEIQCDDNLIFIRITNGGEMS